MKKHQKCIVTALLAFVGLQSLVKLAADLLSALPFALPPDHCERKGRRKQKETWLVSARMELFRSRDRI